MLGVLCGLGGSILAALLANFTPRLQGNCVSRTETSGSSGNRPQVDLTMANRLLLLRFPIPHIVDVGNNPRAGFQILEQLGTELQIE
jgi:hypothetical protein